ncbi:MAG TPA: hypothetical protein VII99_08775 [Bacteroidia bacterium]
MKTLNPQHMQARITTEHLRWAQSVHKALDGGVDMGVPTGKNSAGVYNTFDTGNSSGVLIRVGAVGSTEKYSWSSSSTVDIKHNLARQPIGFKIVDKDNTVDVWRTALPTATDIQLKTSSNMVNVTLYIF